jgi:hypothetical protein
VRDAQAQVLELHAQGPPGDAEQEGGGRVMLVRGPERVGKTTLL